MEIHFLDMGDRPYGDAILVRLHGKNILIDGGHRGDQVRGRSTGALQDQLAALLKVSIPVPIDLLVVTHCHSDHIGCLPELIAQRDLDVRAALVADEKLGFGREATEVPMPLSDDVVVQEVVAALREEPISNGRTDADLAAFIEDAARLEDRYIQMLAALEQSGIPISRCGPDDVRSFVKSLGLRDLAVIPPSEEQLVRCAEAIRRYTESAIQAVAHRRAQDATLSAVRLYQEIARPSFYADLLDAPGKGAALNDQSLLVIAGAGKNKCLLTGDMQFAAPEVKGISREMELLREEVRKCGPFALVKLPHHGSYNGVDESLLQEWGARSLIITTGRGHSAHPSASTLELLGELQGVQWARTDKNGLITARLRNGVADLSIAMGKLNDSSPNVSVDVPQGLGAEVPLREPPGPVKVAVVGERVIEASVGGASQSGDVVEIVARVPNRKTRVTITIDIDPAPQQGAAAKASRPTDAQHQSTDLAKAILGGGRSLPPLLFLTNKSALRSSIGAEALRLVETCVQSAKHELLDVGTDKPWEVVRGRRNRLGVPGVRGIVILGGHDIVPAVKQDVLPPELRRDLGASAQNDRDSFYVWSDDVYGDVDGDGIAELPVSRIPDAGSAKFLLSALAATSARRQGKTGIRNHARPFAERVFSPTGGGRPLLVSHPHVRTELTPSHLDAAALYLMLHGSDADGSTFWGEDSQGNEEEAISVAEVSPMDGAVIFSGCCWGGLTINGLANSNVPPKRREVDRSLALTFLDKGANAFVGCTGAHYSPQAGGNGFGAPMHVNFWRLLDEGASPSDALFGAKEQYRADMFHDAPSAMTQAVEFKILWQFTCLGLAW